MTTPASTKQFTLEDKDGVLVITFSSAPLNYLNMESLAEFELLLPIMAEPHYRAVIFQSRPEEQGFMTHFAVEDSSRPSIGYDVMHRHQEDMLVWREPEEADAKERPAPEIEGTSRLDAGLLAGPLVSLGSRKVGEIYH